MDRFDWIELERVPDSPAAPNPRQVELTDAESYFRAGENMFAVGHFRAAAELYRRAVGMDVRHYAAWVNLIDTLVRARRLDEADTVSEDVLDRFRQVRVLYAARALVLGHRGRLGEALPYSDVSLEGDGPEWYGRCVRGELLLLSGDVAPQETVRCFERAADETRKAWRPFFLGGWVLLEAKKPTWAAAMFSEAARWNPRAPICWLCLGDAFRALRLYDQAEFYYQCAGELDPRNELVVARLKQTVPLIYGLLRIFRKEDVRARWKAEYERMQREAQIDDDDDLYY